MFIDEIANELGRRMTRSELWELTQALEVVYTDGRVDAFDYGCGQHTSVPITIQGERHE